MGVVNDSQSERVADELRRRILNGAVRPGGRLDEASLAAQLEVSRNTLREAFRLLAHEELVVHEPHRGVFVRRFTREEGHHLYAARRALECGVVRDLAAMPITQWLPGVAPIQDIVHGAELARHEGRWNDVGSANSDFHLAVVGLAGNPIVDRVMRTLTSEMRLLFLDLAEPMEVHAQFVEGNRTIVELLAQGQVARAVLELELYLLQAERLLLG